ncbi:MAG: GTP-binding protein, partial [Perlucidibaca sp.]
MYDSAGHAEMAVATHVITGFLGAGKTTLISALLARRPDGERWAVLVNEFGQIGIDQTAWAGDDVLIREVPGGCICCAQNLPLQIALGQIATRAGADRLLIEPTGLGHPAQILETLREPHWQAHLRVGATLCLVDARQLADERVLGHETFRAQVEVADILLFSKADLLDAGTRDRARTFADALHPAKALTAFVSDTGADVVDPAWLDIPPRQPARLRRSLLHLRPAQAGSAAEAG